MNHAKHVLFHKICPIQERSVHIRTYARAAKIWKIYFLILEKAFLYH